MEVITDYLIVIKGSFTYLDTIAKHLFENLFLDLTMLFSNLNAISLMF